MGREFAKEYKVGGLWKPNEQAKKFNPTAVLTGSIDVDGGKRYVAIVPNENRTNEKAPHFLLISSGKDDSGEKLAGLWKGEAAKGPKLRGQFEITPGANGTKASISIWPNGYKKAANQPDFVINIAEPYAVKGKGLFTSPDASASGANDGFGF